MTLSAISKPTTRRDQDVVYTEPDFQSIAQFMHKNTGINLTDGNQRMVYARLCRRVVELGMETFESYIEYFNNPTQNQERDFLISALTTNTTHFFREGYHFEFLRDHIFPELRERARVGQRVRIWSSASSTGEEPYSIAICLADFFPDVFNFDVRILATDIDPEVLQHAEMGKYQISGLKQIPKEYLDKYFSPSTDHLQLAIDKRLKSLISFKRLNLIEDWPFSGHFDVIFCRNVAIYMDLQTQEKVWTGFHRFLKKDGHLFLGHSERISPSLKNAFKIVGNTTYQHLVHPDERLS